MSRIGKNPIVIPDGVKIDLSGNIIKVSGSRGQQSWSIHDNIKVEVNSIRLEESSETPV